MPSTQAAARQAPLRVVADDAGAPRCPKESLTFLFAAEAALERQLGDVRLALQSARESYADAEGALVLPRMELLRTRYGPQVRR
jgi:hypothetical protein